MCRWVSALRGTPASWARPTIVSAPLEFSAAPTRMRVMAALIRSRAVRRLGLRHTAGAVTHGVTQAQRVLHSSIHRGCVSPRPAALPSRAWKSRPGPSLVGQPWNDALEGRRKGRKGTVGLFRAPPRPRPRVASSAVPGPSMEGLESLRALPNRGRTAGRRPPSCLRRVGAAAWSSVRGSARPPARHFPCRVACGPGNLGRLSDVE
jgi:hypothetical protein